MAKQLISFYSNLVKRRPIVTQIATAGIITTTGDVLAQKISSTSKKHDYKRTLIMSSFGFCYFGPMITVWLKILQRLNLRIVYTLICDQGFFAPFMSGSFVFMHPILSGKSVEEAKNIFKTNYLDILTRGWMLWCPAQTINFTFVPYEFRLLYIQSVALVWNTFLSYRSSRSMAKKTEELVEEVP